MKCKIETDIKNSSKKRQKKVMSTVEFGEERGIPTLVITLRKRNSDDFLVGHVPRQELRYLEWVRWWESGDLEMARAMAPIFTVEVGGSYFGVEEYSCKAWLSLVTRGRNGVEIIDDIDVEIDDEDLCRFFFE